MIDVDDLLRAASADDSADSGAVSGAGPEAEETRRPALRVLTRDVGALTAELVEGFDSERAVLEWAQRLTTRTLGECRQGFFSLLAREFRVSGQGPALAAMLVPAARRRELVPHPELVELDADGGADDGTVAERTAHAVRTKIAETVVVPAYHRAYRRLRADAGEYVDEPGQQGQHAPTRQRWIAMRPALDELEHYQQRALELALDGLEERDHVLTWGYVLEEATHGELAESFATQCYEERPTAAMLTDPTTETKRRTRRAFAAAYLIPAFNRGARDLSGRTTEEPDAERADPEVPQI